MSSLDKEESKKQKGSLLLAWQVRDKHCLVIGAGDVALSRVHHMIKAQANITVVTGDSRIHPEILELYDSGKIFRLEKRPYQSSDLTMYRQGASISFDVESLSEDQYAQIIEYNHKHQFEVVCCCIDDHELSTKIYYQCKVLGLNANIADKPELCDFYFGSMINKDSLQIMISTNGKSPRLSKMIKDTIVKHIDCDANKAIDNLNLVRFTLRSRKLSQNDTSTIELRMAWIKNLTDFFTISQWSEVDINDHNVNMIVDYYPEYPPREFEAFQHLLQGSGPEGAETST
ncbi:Bifunctional dehydrogenase and ferrochelatase [Yamadazyma tenuis]|uniref:precorrin-2 dehydrogenase n=1 Tax=Candida tenuis (strain ATCC 10573 / BCRC 21748 / CBS 615 / JCM 9827 / NBRC 10315 / NRRL Y-1498 / VKM Y-70) TaxID=590646 RepID=G3B0Z5_CANTC|nr:siroheme synthase middle domains-like protein [Yamadazyma tenuis ATCC 10573]EGV64844.1 siroheme synthase middle domains-like protein [Yamadazyma tenuis ATCC 10573]WEJ97638.1 Bifunctional dehydrogenase and ferrochelatase [Yamadazyma tenuis]